MGSKLTLTKGMVARLQACKESGLVSELIFEKICSVNNVLFERSSKWEDIHCHIDYWVWKVVDGIHKKKYSVDVKGQKYSGALWVEIKNVHRAVGWLYGKADFICFHVPDMNLFIMVMRESLRLYVEGVVKKEWAGKENSLHRLYRRSGRLDILTRLEFDDFKKMQNVSFYDCDGKVVQR